MAETLQARLSCTIIDAQGTEAQCNSYALVDPAATFETLNATYEAWLAAVDAVTAGRISRAQISFYPELPGLKGAPSTDSRCGETAFLAFTGPTSPRRSGTIIPGVGDSLVLNGRTIITDSGVVAAFIDLIEGGGSGLVFSTSDFDAPLTFKDSAYTFRQYNDQLAPGSFALA